MDIVRISPGSRMSQAVMAAGLVFTAGQVAEGVDVAEQTARILSSIDALLLEAGCGKERIVSASIWLADIDADFSAMNQVWDAWIAPACAPARATVQAKLAMPAFKVEIAVIAALAP